MRLAWRKRFFAGAMVLVSAVAAAALVAWTPGESADNILTSVPDGFLSENFGVEVTAEQMEAPPAVDESAAMAAVRRYSSFTASAPVKEVVLAQVRGKVIGRGDYDGRAWIVSLAMVPPFQGGPMPIEGKCLAPPSSKYTLENTFFLVLVDAESGEVLRAFGGTLEPDRLEELLDCTVTPPVQVPYEPR